MRGGIIRLTVRIALSAIYALRPLSGHTRIAFKSGTPRELTFFSEKAASPSISILSSFYYFMVIILWRFFYLFVSLKPSVPSIFLSAGRTLFHDLFLILLTKIYFYDSIFFSLFFLPDRLEIERLEKKLHSFFLFFLRSLDPLKPMLKFGL